MSDGKNALKLPGDHIDFNLDLKTILSPLFDAQKSIYTKKKKKKKSYLKHLIFWSHLFRPTQNTGGQENGNYELRNSFSNSPIC